MPYQCLYLETIMPDDPLSGVPAQRLARVPGIWRAGMLADCGRRGMVRITDPALFAENYLVQHGAGWTAPTPCLDDPIGATTGCLAAFCRELYGEPYLFVHPMLTRPDDQRWRTHYDGTMFCGPTEAEAWSVAILAHSLEPAPPHSPGEE